MLRYPDLDNDPGVEPWKGMNEEGTSADEGWNREKVENDITSTMATTHEFTSAQVGDVQPFTKHT
eukprot:4793041-Pleurochrysis_carterae.AAC.1